MRYTEKNRFNEYATIDAERDYRAMVQKLGQLEDIMEKYDINSAEELEHIILNDATGEEAFREYFETNVMPYRNIEKELGINLVTLIKALKDGIWTWNDKDHKEHFFEKPLALTKFIMEDKYEEKETKTYRLVGVDYYELKDYGKTWALTKEELE